MRFDVKIYLKVCGLLGASVSAGDVRPATNDPCYRLGKLNQARWSTGVTASCVAEYCEGIAYERIGSFSIVAGNPHGSTQMSCHQAETELLFADAGQISWQIPGHSGTSTNEGYSHNYDGSYVGAAWYGDRSFDTYDQYNTVEGHSYNTYTYLTPSAGGAYDYQDLYGGFSYHSTSGETNRASPPSTENYQGNYDGYYTQYLGGNGNGKQDAQDWYGAYSTSTTEDQEYYRGHEVDPECTQQQGLYTPQSWTDISDVKARVTEVVDHETAAIADACLSELRRYFVSLLRGHELVLKKSNTSFTKKVAAVKRCTAVLSTWGIEERDDSYVIRSSVDRSEDSSILSLVKKIDELQPSVQGGIKADLRDGKNSYRKKKAEPKVEPLEEVRAVIDRIAKDRSAAVAVESFEWLVTHFERLARFHNGNIGFVVKDSGLIQLSEKVPEVLEVFKAARWIVEKGRMHVTQQGQNEALAEAICRLLIQKTKELRDHVGQLI
jgi:hypothetical protein